MFLAPRFTPEHRPVRHSARFAAARLRECGALTILALSALFVAQAVGADPLFGPGTDYATGQRPQGVAIADLNRDGCPDLAVANNSDATVSMFLGNGDGSFEPKVDISLGFGNAPSALAIGDLNGDALLDLVTVGNGDSMATVLLGNGNGSFGGINNYRIGSYSNSVAIGDLNADGRPDLVTSNYFAPYSISVLLGNGDGSFGPKTDLATGTTPNCVAIGDLNEDGRPDIAVAVPGTHPTYSDGHVSVFPGDGLGNFGAKSDFDTGNGPASVAIADFNGDGKADLATANFGASTDSTVSILLGNGDGSFGANTDFTAGRYSIALAVGDLNGDTRPDLAVANTFSRTVSALLGNGDGTFQEKSDFGVGNTPWFVAIGDLNGDGEPDLAVANTNSHTVSVLLNSPSPTPTLLARFEAEETSGGIQLRWQFGDPARVVGASLERAASQTGPWLALDLDHRNLAAMNEALDRTAVRGETYYYRLTANLTDGTHAEFGPIRATALLAASVSGLTGVSPNPVFENARIDFALTRPEKVRVSIVDVMGREAVVLADQPMAPGHYSLLWDGRQAGTRLPAGVYYIRWASTDRSMNRPLVLLH